MLLVSPVPPVPEYRVPEGSALEEWEEKPEKEDGEEGEREQTTRLESPRITVGTESGITGLCRPPQHQRPLSSLCPHGVPCAVTPSLPRPWTGHGFLLPTALGKHWGLVWETLCPFPLGLVNPYPPPRPQLRGHGLREASADAHAPRVGCRNVTARLSMVCKLDPRGYRLAQVTTGQSVLSTLPPQGHGLRMLGGPRVIQVDSPGFLKRKQGLGKTSDFPTTS